MSRLKMKFSSRVSHRNGRHTYIQLMINELLRSWLLFLVLLSITMSSTAAIMASLPAESPMSVSMPASPLHPHAQSNYHEPNIEAFAGLAGYASTRHYYDTATAAADGLPIDDGVGDLVATPYANYEPKAVSTLGSTATGFVPTTALHSYNNRLQSGYGTRHRGKIDFVINTPNYELDANEEQPDVYYQRYSYQPQPQPQPQPQAQAPIPPMPDYHIEQFSNYRHPAVGRDQEADPQQSRQGSTDHSMTYKGRSPRPQLESPDKRQQHRHGESTHDGQSGHKPNSHHQQEDQQLLYSQAEDHIVDLPSPNSIHHSLPPITTTVHHTSSSKKAIAGVPLAKHIEVTKHVPVTHYQKVHVPYKQPVQLRISRPVITTIPKPIPIKIPVPRAVAVPQVQEVKIPMEKIKPFPVERPIPFVVERRVPYRVEKPVATPVYYPYPVKVPIIRTVVHKQRPQYTISSQGLGTYGVWNSGNQLLG